MNPQTPPMPDPAELLRQLWQDDDDPARRGPCPTGRYFDAPLVAVASADDPWFARLQEHIGPFHFLPAEALKLVYPTARARSVVSYVLPICAEARAANCAEDRQPSEPWARVRTFGEQLNDRLRAGLVEAFGRAGFSAVAPGSHPANDVRDTPQRPLNSRWSERHVAFIAGLWTFGISGGLITQAGVAVRLGSVVTEAPLPVTARPYGEDPFAWCLKSALGTCGACMARCPVGSVGPDHEHRDKRACLKHIRSVRNSLAHRFGFDGVYGCGLCQTALPCESRNPTQPRSPESSP
ncbi:MAG: 4Fe-4S ferredoxin [Phycisphaerae bacterium]